MFTELVLNTDC